MNYETRQRYACKVCQNVPDEGGNLDHGKGCYVANDDGGGTSFINFQIRKRNDAESGNIAVDVAVGNEWFEIFQHCNDEDADQSIADLLEWKRGG